MFEAHQTQAASPGGAAHPTLFARRVVRHCGDRPEDVDDRRTLRRHTGRVWPEHSSGNPWRLSSGGSRKRSAAIRNRCDNPRPCR